MPTDRAAPGPGADKSYTFLARYGSTILRGGIAAIPTALFTYQALLDLSPQEAWFISYILAHKWDEDLPYPSLRKMAERTGLSVRQLHRIKDAIVEKGYLHLVPRRRADDGGQDSNAYDFAGLFGRIEELLRAEGRLAEQRQRAPYPEPGGADPVERVARPLGGGGRVVRAPVAPAPPATAAPRARASQGGVTPASSGGMTTPAPGARTAATAGRGTAVTPPAAPRRTPAPASGMAPEKSPALKANKNPDKNPESIPPSAFIMSVVSDFSRELGDTAHETANMLQANHLWHESGLGEQAFVDLLYEARGRTRRAQGAQGAGQIQNRAAYFFTVLRALVSEGPPEPDAGT
jgi:hypothetical protein